MLAVFKELYYAANDQKMADKKKADYQEGLEKSCADSAAQSCDSYMKDSEKVLHEATKDTLRIRKRVVLTVQHKATKMTRMTWRSHDDSAARSCENYLKDSEKRRARNRESYMKYLEKSHADSAARSTES